MEMEKTILLNYSAAFAGIIDYRSGRAPTQGLPRRATAVHVNSADGQETPLTIARLIRTCRHAIVRHWNRVFVLEAVEHVRGK